MRYRIYETHYLGSLLEGRTAFVFRDLFMLESDVLPAADRDCLAGNSARFIGCEENRNRRHLRFFSHSLERRIRSEVFHDLLEGYVRCFGLGSHRIRDMLPLDRAWADSVDPDIKFSYFNG